MTTEVDLKVLVLSLCPSLTSRLVISCITSESSLVQYLENCTGVLRRRMGFCKELFQNSHNSFDFLLLFQISLNQELSKRNEGRKLGSLQSRF